MAFKEQQHPFYKPLWRRVVIVALIAFWLAFELLSSNSGFWVALSGGMLAYAVYIFFLTWPKEGPKDDEAPPA